MAHETSHKAAERLDMCFQEKSLRGGIRVASFPLRWLWVMDPWGISFWSGLVATSMVEDDQLVAGDREFTVKSLTHPKPQKRSQTRRSATNL